MCQATFSAAVMLPKPTLQFGPATVHLKISHFKIEQEAI